MNNLKTFENFLNESLSPSVVIKSKKNPDFYIKISFDNKDKVNHIENKWHVNIPNWYGLDINNKDIAAFVAKDPDLYIADNLVAMTSNDKTENEKYIIGNYVIFNHYKTNNNADTRPYRYVGKILDNTVYNRLTVEVMKRLYGEKLKVNNDDYSDIKLGDIKEIHVGNVDLQTSNYDRFLEDDDKEVSKLPQIAYDEAIKDVLRILYKGSIYDTVNKVDERIDQLFSIHAVWLDKAKKHFSAMEIAKKLFTYEKNLNR